MQIAGRGGGCEEAVCPRSVLEVPVQGSQHHFQPDDPLLSKTDRAASSPHAGPPYLCFSLLLGYAGRGTVRPLGLGGLRVTNDAAGKLWQEAFVVQCCSPLIVYLSVLKGNH